jgi:hypothetical protein
MIVTMNNLIACEPPVMQGATTNIEHGVARYGHRSTLTALKTAYAYNEIPAGSTIYVRSSMLSNAKWANDVFTVGDVKFVLVPKTDIVMIDADIERAGYLTATYLSAAGAVDTTKP